MVPVLIGNGSLYCCDVRDGLTAIDSSSVDCVVTSPPYWQLRNYGVEGQIGQEKEYQDFVDNLISIFNDMRRVLKPTATVFVNISDTYSQSGGAGNQKMNRKLINQVKGHSVRSINPKSLAGIPFRFATGMIDNGWTLRNTIIWQKPNAMPSSAKDRFTIDHEYIFFFTLNKSYYFQQLFEPIQEATRKRAEYGRQKIKTEAMRGLQKYGYNPDKLPGRNKRTVWSISTQSYFGSHIAAFPLDIALLPITSGCPQGGVVLDPFMGSGTSAVAAEMRGCRWIGIDLDEHSIIETKARIQDAKKKGKIPA